MMMKFKPGDRVPYVDDEGFFCSPVLEQLTIKAAIKKYGNTKISNYDKRPQNTMVVVYEDGGWDWLDSLVPAEIFYSALYQVMQEDEENY